MNSLSQNQYLFADQKKDLNQFMFDLLANIRRAEPQYLENEIRQGIEYLAHFLNFDWVTICEFAYQELTNPNLYWYSHPSVIAPEIHRFHEVTGFPTETIRSGQTIVFSDVEREHPKNIVDGRLYCLKNGIKSTVVLPLKISNVIQGGVYLSSLRKKQSFTDDIIESIHNFSEVLASALERRRAFEGQQKALEEIECLKRQESESAIRLQTKVENDPAEEMITGNSQQFKEVLAKSARVAHTNAPVLLLGETGTGKGMLAKAIHNASDRKRRQFVQVNCAGFSPSLIESELFGHEKGAFTGADSRRAGCFERAEQSTLFLDEISEIPVELQGKLLRVLQEGEFERVGGVDTLKANARIITATNKNLEQEVQRGRFRQDLLFRLSVYPIHLPNLVARKEDIPLLIDSFIRKYAKWAKQDIKQVSSRSLNHLKDYFWPGNIRELENMIARAIIDSSDGILRIEPTAFKDFANCPNTAQKSLVDFERQHILETLNKCMWRIEGQNGAAKRLGLNPSTLRTRMKKHSIKRP